MKDATAMNADRSSVSPNTLAVVMGASGLLGPYLMEAAGSRNTVVGVSRRGPEVQLDLLDFHAVRCWLRETRPSLVIYAAALTDVDRCEREPALADALHRQAVENVQAALREDASLVYISTDQVYPDTPGPHREVHTGPINVYGHSKLEGENAALQHPGSLVVRTNLFGPSHTAWRQSLSDFMRYKFSTGEPVSLFRDVLFTPLQLSTLAHLVMRLVTMDIHGVFNLGSRDGMSKMEFGYAIASHFGLPTDQVKEVDSSTLPGRVHRIKDMRMDVSRVEQTLNTRMPTLLEEIAKL